MPRRHCSSPPRGLHLLHAFNDPTTLRELPPVSEFAYPHLMPAQQLRFFKRPKPLLDRFGAEFFRSLPSKPGVYIMSGEAGRVLYVGQSKNLRVRLGTYRNANPCHISRKTI